ncbi:LysR substrate-binding domain-containing protein [Rhizobium sp. SGZ-381]|uniref:LysR substrate-binding domain-containing protein n=1 Tax=Rhizobium sp. SGZ-381 TaxID=3342800 RepID=UPI00366AFFD1
MKDDLPSLSGLRAFEASARHLSMKRASEELHVTPGAISLQVRELEATLDVKLFERHPRQLSLTAAGTEYFLSLRTAFGLMREATQAVRHRRGPHIVTMSCTTGFATQWLMPKLDGLQDAHPEIDLRIGTTARLVDFMKDDIDIAVRHGLGGYAGLISEKLLDDDMIVVTNPARAKMLGPQPDPNQLDGRLLIHDVEREHWRLWLAGVNALSVDWRSGIMIAPDSNGALDAARAGLGFALVRRSFVAQDLAEQRLCAPFSQSLTSRYAYYLVYPPTALERPAVRRLRDWLCQCAGR